MNHPALPAPTPSPVVGRGVLTAFCGAALVLLACLFRDGWLHGYVLGQADILFEYLPWKAHRPVGLRTANRLFHDVPTVFYPFMYHARHALLNGEFPLWSTAIGAGHPFFASFQSAVLSPFTIFTYALPFPASFTADAAARLFAGGLGMFLYLRALNIGAAGAAFGGMAFLLNPFSIVWLEHPLSAAAASLPWMLLAVEGCARRRDAVAIAAMAAVTALALFTGHPETAFKAALLAGAYAIYRGLTNRCLIRTLACVAAGMLLGVLLAAIQVLPFLEYVRESRTLAARAEGGAPLFTNPLVSVVTTFVPDFFATPVRNRYVLPGGNYAEQQVYPGIFTWVLAAASVTHRRFRSLAVFFLTISALAMLIMYGTPVADLALAIVPPLRYAALSRFGLIAIAGTILAAAIAVDAVIESAQSDHRRWRVHAAIAIIAAAVIASIVAAFLLAQRDLLDDTRQWPQTLRGTARAARFLVAAVAVIVAARWLPGWLLRMAPAGLIALELFAFADGLHPMVPRERSFPPLAEVAALRQDGDIFRVAGWSQTLLPNTSLLYGVQDFRSYDGIGIRHYSALLDVGFHFNGAAHEFVNFGSAHLLDLLNVKYLLLPADIEPPAGARERFELVLDGPTRVFRNRTVLPRAFLVDQVLRTTGDEARRTIRDGFDMRRVALVDRLPASAERPEASAGSPGDAAIIEYSNRKVVVKTSAEGARLLVLTDVFYPGWRADVDGRDTTIYRANYAFRGVPIAAGAHTVTFRYEPRSFRYGAWISGAAGLLLAALLVIGRRRAIKRRGLPSSRPQVQPGS